MAPAVRSPLARSLAVGLVALAIAAAIVANAIAAADPAVGEGRIPFASVYVGERDHLDALLVSGDGQAFGAIAQDPLLRRPEAIPGDGEFAYRAQRPTWSYAAWALSLGQPDAVGWALAAMTVLAAAACCAVVSLLLMRRELQPWWSLALLLAGLESLSQLTPELAALALFGTALLTARRHVGWSVALATLAVLSRETMLVGLVAWLAFEVVRGAGSLTERVRSVLPWTIPFVCFAGWVVLLRVRVGTWTWEQPHERTTLPFVGLRDAFDPISGRITIGVLVALAVCAICVVTARADVLSWVAVAFAGFATLFSGQVWTGAGYERTLLPLYVLGGVAALAGLTRRRRGSRPTTTEPAAAPVALAASTS